ncbi:MAG: pyridoxamine 5'-phosphate oxidase family protein, partial [Candidatus Eremiobacteraeota bacterium]|nr:pyridoxamine 5'-phosphate oxidase family protein [Candidatus Eremiobacteraeota bacterium]
MRDGARTRPPPVSDAIGSARIAYEFATLDERDVAADPLEQFATWLSAAFGIEGITEPNAMTLATVGQDSRPSARIVLLRGFDARGFTFFTNFESRKARELGANANAALVFYWGPLQRQIRIEGSVARIEG